MKNELRWGLIGYGDIVRKRVGAALRDASGSALVAVCRGQPAQAEAAARELGAPKWHRRWEDLAMDPEVDAVYVATPVDLHAEQTIAAARAGKHVLCEKPMALTLRDCDRMIDACGRDGVRLGIAYYRRFYPVIQRIKEILAAGEIGKPIVAQINAFEWLEMAPDHPRHWFLEKARSGGGPMFDFGCHRIEALMSLFGPVQATIGRLGNVLFDRDVEDTAIACLEMVQGTRAVLTVTHAAQESQDTLDIFGDRGSIHVPVLNQGRMRIVTASEQRLEEHPNPPNIHRPLVEDFVNAVRTGRDPLVDGGVGRAVAAVIERIYAQG